MKALYNNHLFNTLYHQDAAYIHITFKNALPDIIKEEQESASKRLKKLIMPLKPKKMIIDFSDCDYYAVLNANIFLLEQFISEMADIVEKRLAFVVAIEAYDEISLSGISIPMPEDNELEIKYYRHIDMAKKWLQNNNQKALIS